MVKVDLLDLKVTQVQKRRLAESLTKVVSETLGYGPETVMIVFTMRSKQDIAWRKIRPSRQLERSGVAGLTKEIFV